MLRAYDKTTGKEVGAVLMPAAQSGSPMTYMVDNRQYIIVAVSGGNYSGEYICVRASARRKVGGPGFRRDQRGTMKRFWFGIAVAAAIAVAAVMNVRAAGLPACDPDNGGLKLPQGFCALVAADNLGAARHMVVMPNGDLYVTTQGTRDQPRRGVGLRDTNGDGKMDVTERLRRQEHDRDRGAQRISLHRHNQFGRAVQADAKRTEAWPGRSRRRRFAGHASAPGQRTRLRWTRRALRQHRRAIERLPAAGPPPESAGAGSLSAARDSGGIWKFDENKLGQKQADGVRYATGHASDAGHHVAGRRAVRGDEQSRSDRHALVRFVRR